MKTNKQIETQVSLKNIMLKLGFEKLEYYNGRSFIYNCSFYKSNFEKIIITDYDFKEDKPLIDNTCIIFNTNSGSLTKIALEFIENAQKAFKELLLKISKE